MFSPKTLTEMGLGNICTLRVFVLFSCTTLRSLFRSTWRTLQMYHAEGCMSCHSQNKLCMAGLSLSLG